MDTEVIFKCGIGFPWLYVLSVLNAIEIQDLDLDNPGSDVHSAIWSFLADLAPVFQPHPFHKENKGREGAMYGTQPWAPEGKGWYKNVKIKGLEGHPNY